MRVLIFSALAIALAGCMPSTMTELRRDGTSREVHIDLPYQQVYRNLNAAAHNCVLQTFALATADIDAQLYPDLDLGEITVRWHNMGDQSVLWHATARKDAGGTSASFLAPRTDQLDSLERWARGGECATS